MVQNEADKLFAEAQRAEEAHNYSEAIQKYEKAKEKYLLLPKKKIFALMCVANITMNRIRISSFGLVEMTEDEPAKEILNKMEQTLDEVGQKHFNEPNLRLPFIRYRILIYRELENFLLSFGLKNESIRMYIKYRRWDRKRLQIIRKKAHWRSPKLKLLSLLRENYNRFIDLLFGYGVRAWNLIFFSFVSWIIFGILFYMFQLVQYTGPQETTNKPNFWDSLYFSMVTLTNLGSEVLKPAAERGGRIVECFEAIIGYIILGVLVAYFSKRIR